MSRPGLALDGANLWVSNNGDSTGASCGASDGANLGTFSVVGAPMGVAFDGANIRVANSFPNTVTKLRGERWHYAGEVRGG